MKKEGGGAGLRMGTATAELKLTAGRALHAPLLPKVAWRQGLGGGPPWKRRGGGSPALPSPENVQALNLANSLEAFFLSARATWILGPIS